MWEAMTLLSPNSSSIPHPPLWMPETCLFLGARFGSPEPKLPLLKKCQRKQELFSSDADL